MLTQAVSCSMNLFNGSILVPDSGSIFICHAASLGYLHSQHAATGKNSQNVSEHLLSKKMVQA